MVTDALLAPLIAMVSYVVNLLPVGGALGLPSLGGMWLIVRQLDSLVPVLGPIQALLALLAFGALFIVVRLVLTVWNLIWP